MIWTCPKCNKKHAAKSAKVAEAIHKKSDCYRIGPVKRTKTNNKQSGLYGVIASKN